MGFDMRIQRLAQRRLIRLPGLPEVIEHELSIGSILRGAME